MYVALGLNTSHVDEKRLRSSFRRRARATHPDKVKVGNLHSFNPEEEFRLVSEAYSMLKGKKRSADTIEDVFISLSDLLTRGPNILVHSTRRSKTPCIICLGTGSPAGNPAPTLCPTCRGAGTSTVTWGCQGNQPCVHLSGTCGTCGGQGWIGQLCRACRGEGITTESRSYNVEFPTGSQNFHTLRAVGEGDVKDKFSRPGDLLFRLNVKPHSLYEMVKNTLDLKTRMEMSVERLRSSFHMNVERIGGSRQGYVEFNVPSYPTMQPGETRTVTLTDFTDYGNLLLEMHAKEEVWTFKN
jgi:DnaJ-class molecular chaperone